VIVLLYIVAVVSRAISVSVWFIRTGKEKKKRKGKKNKSFVVFILLLLLFWGWCPKCRLRGGGGGSFQGVRQNNREIY
jgi:NADH:ubiquinone oxidoreductase subunit 6 (subunit J)